MTQSIRPLISKIFSDGVTDDIQYRTYNEYHHKEYDQSEDTRQQTEEQCGNGHDDLHHKDRDDQRNYVDRIYAHQHNGNYELVGIIKNIQNDTRYLTFRFTYKERIDSLRSLVSVVDTTGKRRISENRNSGVFAKLISVSSYTRNKSFYKIKGDIYTRLITKAHQYRQYRPCRDNVNKQ